MHLHATHALHQTLLQPIFLCISLSRAANHERRRIRQRRQKVAGSDMGATFAHCLLRTRTRTLVAMDYGRPMPAGAQTGA